MNIEFKYNIEKDAENFLIVAKAKKIKISSSFLEEKRFLKYKMYFEKYGPIFSKSKLKKFINEYIEDNKIDIIQELKIIENKWAQVNKSFWSRAEKFFRTKLPHRQITVYLTVSDVCGYNIKDGYFFITLKSSCSNLIIMHELWHFFTWYSFGKKFKETNVISKEKYYDIKESLTEILNLEFKDLLGNQIDKGYPDHQKIRKKVKKLWVKYENIKKVVDKLLEH
ncbi:MAG: hypothetical protein HQ541_11145 [Mariniphaga sp.]|nr:hypothetical protein [Mariniphaga sp.]